MSKKEIIAMIEKLKAHDERLSRVALFNGNTDMYIALVGGDMAYDKVIKNIKKLSKKH